MSDQTAEDFEVLVRRALAPVDPPDGLAQRLEATLRNLTELAADELEGWELRSMRDPRNWVRPVLAAAVGTAAGTGLIVLRIRSQRRHRSLRLAAAHELRRIARR
jgi:hypothetical protein